MIDLSLTRRAGYSHAFYRQGEIGGELWKVTLGDPSGLLRFIYRPENLDLVRFGTSERDDLFHSLDSLDSVLRNSTGYSLFTVPHAKPGQQGEHAYRYSLQRQIPLISLELPAGRDKVGSLEAFADTEEKAERVLRRLMWYTLAPQRTSKYLRLRAFEPPSDVD